MMSSYLCTFYCHPKYHSTCWYNFPILFAINHFHCWSKNITKKVIIFSYMYAKICVHDYKKEN